jgi:hypothetical protein
VADAARAGGRDDVACVVLGAGADEATVAHWLRQAATVDGFVGFAIGRTIFWDALKGWLADTIDRATAVDMIADNYRSTIDLYEARQRRHREPPRFASGQIQSRPAAARVVAGGRLAVHAVAVEVHVGLRGGRQQETDRIDDASGHGESSGRWGEGNAHGVTQSTAASPPCPM